jgi:hypothetical protein
MTRAQARPLRLTAYTDSTTRGGAEQSVATLLAHLDERVPAIDLLHLEES